MTIGNHDEGFEKEAKLRAIHAQVAHIQDSLYQWATFMEVARLIHPGLCEGAFTRRPCRRKLRYIGHDNWPEPIRSELNAQNHRHFVQGDIYYSTDFNGATYSIEGWSERECGRATGCAYFEWVKDEEIL